MQNGFECVMAVERGMWYVARKVWTKAIVIWGYVWAKLPEKWLVVDVEVLTELMVNAW